MFEEFDQELDTYDVEEKLEHCDSVEELKTEILPLLKSQKQQWEKEINRLLKKNCIAHKAILKESVGFQDKASVNGVTDRSRRAGSILSESAW